MKIFLFVILFASTAFADGAVDQKHIHFQYNLDGKTFYFTSRDGDYYKAIEEGAMRCYHFFTKDVIESSEDRKLEIIDVCANPR